MGKTRADGEPMRPAVRPDGRRRATRSALAACWLAATLALGACGATAVAPTAPPTLAPTAAPARTATSAPVAPAATPTVAATASRTTTATRAASPGATATRGAVDVPAVANFAIAALAGQLGVPPGQITVTRAEKVEWPDSSLGCPEPGRGYLQVITPGYRLILTAGGKDYEYHTNETNMVVRCSA